MPVHNIFDLSGQVAAIVGGGSGIGEAVALGAARAGARVTCLDVKADAAERVAAAARAEGCECDAASLDIRDAAAVDAAFARIRDARGSLDIVICTPGVNVRKKILDYQNDELDRVLDLNLKGNFYVLRAAGRIMTAERRGSIVLFSSIRSQVVEPGQSVYAATKAGIVQMVARRRLRVRSVRRARQRDRPGRDRDAADRADQERSGLVQGLRREERDESVGKAGGDGRAGAVPCVGRRQLRDRDDPVRRWRVAGAGR